MSVFSEEWQQSADIIIQQLKNDESITPDHVVRFVYAFGAFDDSSFPSIDDCAYFDDHLPMSYVVNKFNNNLKHRFVKRKWIYDETQDEKLLHTITEKVINNNYLLHKFENEETETVQILLNVEKNSFSISPLCYYIYCKKTEREPSEEDYLVLHNCDTIRTDENLIGIYKEFGTYVCSNYFNRLEIFTVSKVAYNNHFFRFNDTFRLTNSSRNYCYENECIDSGYIELDNNKLQKYYEDCEEEIFYKLLFELVQTGNIEALQELVPSEYISIQQIRRELIENAKCLPKFGKIYEESKSSFEKCV